MSPGYRCMLIPMSDELDLISELLAATANAHSARTLVKAFAERLARHAPITRVAIAVPAPCAVELIANEWRPVADPHAAAARYELAPGLTVTTRSTLPALLTTPSFRNALAQVL